MALIFEKYGCKVIKKGEQYFVQFDSGQSAGSRLIEKSITYSQFERIKMGEREAYNVLLELEQ